MGFKEDERSLAWESIRKLLNATKNYQVLSPEEVLNLGAYFARGSKKMVTLPLALVEEYDKELRYFSQDWADSMGDHPTYIRLHAKLEEYLPVNEPVEPNEM